jgi:hypothetical protein
MMKFDPLGPAYPDYPGYQDEPSQDPAYWHARAVEELSEQHDAWTDAQDRGEFDDEELPDDDEELVIELELDEDWGVKPEPKQINLTPAQLRPIVSTLKEVRGLLDMPPPDWFIKDLVPAGPVTVLHGISGSKKSFLLLDWMMCAAHGLDWHGHPIRPGRVLYIVAEGLTGMGKRVRAWAAHHDLDPYDLKMVFVDRPINLFKLTLEQRDHWRELVRYMGFGYIVVDTLHMTSAGADENSSKDMGEVFSHLKEIAGDARVFVAHHDPKDGKSARGSGSIRDDSDQCLSLTEITGLTSALSADRMKDAGNFQPIALTFVPVDTSHGRSIAISEVKVGAEEAKLVESDKPTRVDEARDAIVTHGLDYRRGEAWINDRLRELDLGLKFAPATIGKALKQLRGAAQEVHDMNARRDDLDKEDQ